MTPRVILFLPVYNEELRIGEVLERCRVVLEKGIVHTVLAVDDGSTDGTPGVLRRHAYCTVLTHPSRQGCGDAIRSAYRYARTLVAEAFRHPIMR